MTIKELFAPSDMTVGKPWEKIVAFTIPMLIGNIAQQLYNTVDSIVIGKYVGDNALAAVGSASPIFFVIHGLDTVDHHNLWLIPFNYRAYGVQTCLTQQFQMITERANPLCTQFDLLQGLFPGHIQYRKILPGQIPADL